MLIGLSVIIQPKIPIRQFRADSYYRWHWIVWCEEPVVKEFDALNSDVVVVQFTPKDDDCAIVQYDSGGSRHWGVWSQEILGRILVRDLKH